MSPIAVFKAPMLIGDYSDDDPERLTLELSRPLASSLHGTMKELGYLIDTDEPFSGEWWMAF